MYSLGCFYQVGVSFHFEKYVFAPDAHHTRKNICMLFFFFFLKINAEFVRITNVPLQPRFLASLDKHHSKLIEIIRNKGGAVREKTSDILKPLNHICTLNIVNLSKFDV